MDHEEAKEEEEDGESSGSDSDYEEEDDDEGAKGRGSGDGNLHPCADVRMIDFAHVELRPPPPPTAEARAGCWREDENYMFGLASLLEHLRRLWARARELEAGETGPPPAAVSGV